MNAQVQISRQQTSSMSMFTLMLMALVWNSAAVLCHASDDIDPATHDWNNYDGWATFYVVDPYGDGYWTGTKYVLATDNFISGHCETDGNTDIEHYHYQNDFTSSTRQHADNYWDWYYDEGDEEITRSSSATNTRESLADAFDGRTGGDYNYWVFHGDGTNQGDTIIDDDLTTRDGDPQVGDFYAYSVYSEVEHVSRVTGVTGELVSEITWKCDYSGVYVYERFAPDSCSKIAVGTSTPGRSNLEQNIQGGPSGDWVPDYWSDPDVYYAP